MLQVSEIDPHLEAALFRPVCSTNDSDSEVADTSRDNTKIAITKGEDAMQYYERVKSSKHRKRMHGDESIQEMEDSNEEGKRAITFQVLTIYH